MQQGERINHEGFVSAVNGKHIQVTIVNMSACSACHAKGACTAADKENKTIDIIQDIPGIRTGTRVTISGERRTGMQAVLLAYVYPLILMMAVLAFAYTSTGNELTAGLAALLCLVPYYLLLTLFKKHFQKRFSFQITHQS